MHTSILRVDAKGAAGGATSLLDRYLLRSGACRATGPGGRSCGAREPAALMAAGVDGTLALRALHVTPYFAPAFAYAFTVCHPWSPSWQQGVSSLIWPANSMSVICFSVIGPCVSSLM